MHTDQLTKYSILIAACLFAWALPSSQTLCSMVDERTFFFLNSSLLYSREWQLLWGYLNHPNENWLNVCVMFGINIIGIFSLPKPQRRAGIVGVLYFWLFFQLVLLMTHCIFAKWLVVQRASPSTIFTPLVILSDTLSMPDLKTVSYNCFPAGHAIVAVYWAKFTFLYSKPKVYPIVLATVAFLLLPRLFTGAHWLSDIVFSIFYALLWFAIAHGTPLFALATRCIDQFFSYMQNTLMRINLSLRAKNT